MPGHHKDRIAEDIKREIAAIVRELKDPRVKDSFVTIVRAEVAHDASFAKVYVSSLNGLDTAKQAVKGLESAAGHIRGQLSARLHIRKSPELKFIADDSVEYGLKIAKKLDDLGL